VFTDAEPSALPTGVLLRRLLAGEFPTSPWATAALFLADRINQNTDPANGLIKHLDAGETVILDRYYYSTFAYQGCETNLDWTMDIHYRCPELRRPDLVLYLTMSPEKCVERIRMNRRAEDLELYETAERLDATDRQFKAVFAKLRDRENVVEIDADGTVEEVHGRILAAAESVLRAPRRKKLLLFDFDGTVIDNSEGIFNCVNYAADKLGLPRPAQSDLRAFVGPPLYDSFAKYMGADHETALKLVDAYRERYAPQGINEAVLYPGMSEMLAALQAQGYTLAVCSGKPRDFVMRIARRLGIFDRFSGFYCTTFADTGLKKEDYIRQAMAQFGASQAETLMIGDTKSDVLAAKKAGVESVGVTYGFAAPGELEACAPEYYAESVPALYRLLTGRALQ
jgi:phosphoglycolate phosphatase